MARSDNGKPRILRVKGQEPVNFSFQLRRDDAIEAQILKAIESDFRLNKTNRIKTVLIPWLSDYLGVKK